MEYKKGIIKSPTSSGKSLIIAYIIKTLFENNLSEKALIIVPNINLITQFYTDLNEYNMPYNVGKIWAQEKNTKQ